MIEIATTEQLLELAIASVELMSSREKAELREAILTPPPQKWNTERKRFPLAKGWVN